MTNYKISNYRRPKNSTIPSIWLRNKNNRRQSLARAVGLKKGWSPLIIDATAGLGRDSFTLASLGSEVVLIERSPKIFEMLHENIVQARNGYDGFASIAKRMKPQLGDSRFLLPKMSADVILIDPMHPPRQKSALVKKEMRFLRSVVGDDEDVYDLIKIALTIATDRVVLKWPLRAEPISELVPPSHQICGRKIRFDVFLTRNN